MDQYVVSELVLVEPVDLVQVESDQIAYPEPQAIALPMLTVARSDVIPPGAEELASKPLPALVRYFDQKEAGDSNWRTT